MVLLTWQRHDVLNAHEGVCISTLPQLLARH